MNRMMWLRWTLGLALLLCAHPGTAVTINFDDIPTVFGGAPTAFDGDRYYDSDGVRITSSNGDLYAFAPTTFATNTPNNYIFSNTADEPGSCVTPGVACNALGDIMFNLYEDPGDDVEGVTDMISFYIADSQTGTGSPWYAAIFDIEGEVLDEVFGDTNDEVLVSFVREGADIHKLLFRPFDGEVGDSSGLDTLEFGEIVNPGSVPEAGTLLLLGASALVALRRSR